MVESEMYFADIFDVMSLSEKFIKFSLKYVLEKNNLDIEFIKNNYEKDIFQKLESIVKADFKRITYNEAIQILTEASKYKKNFFYEKVSWGIDLGSEHEKYLTDKVFKGPVFVYNFPKRSKPFYVKNNHDEEETVAAVDLLVPGIGEILGGSEREYNQEILKAKIFKLCEQNSKPFQPYRGYLDTRKFGGAPHSGFGIGFDRLVMLATGMTNIKDVIPYPRDSKHAEF